MERLPVIFGDEAEVQISQIMVDRAASGQPPQGAPQGAPAGEPAQPPGGAISAGQIQRWFEAFTVLQAQEALQLSEAQYGRFVTRLKSLQDTRRKHHACVSGSFPSGPEAPSSFVGLTRIDAPEMCVLRT